MRSDSEQLWDPRYVGKELVAALKWAQRSGGRVGPAGFGSGMPEIVMHHFDRLAEQWPLVRDLDPSPKRRQEPPSRVSQMERVLLWQSQYLIVAPQSAWALNMWLFTKLHRSVSYSEIIARNDLSRATAYRRRDRALAFIALGLTRDGVVRGKH